MVKKTEEQVPTVSLKSKAKVSSTPPAPEAAAVPTATASSTSFALSAEQSAFLKSLTPVADVQVARMRKTSSDVTLALNEQVLQAIHDNAALGGPARASRLTSLIAQQGKLLAVQAVLEPLMQLVANNLLAANAELADGVYEALKVAEAVAKTQPELGRALKPAEDWSKSHHRPRRATASAPKA